MTPVVEHLVAELDRNERKLLRWLLTSNTTKRHRTLRSFRRQVLDWAMEPKYLTPLSSKQWTRLAIIYLSYKDYRELLVKVGKVDIPVKK